MVYTVSLPFWPIYHGAVYIISSSCTLEYKLRSSLSAGFLWHENGNAVVIAKAQRADRFIYIYIHIHIAYHLRFLRQKTDFWGQQVTAVCAWIHLFQPMSQWLTFTVYGINVMPLGINSNLTDVVYEIQWWEKHSPHLNQNSDIMSVKTTKSLCVL